MNELYHTGEKMQIFNLSIGRSAENTKPTICYSPPLNCSCILYIRKNLNYTFSKRLTQSVHEQQPAASRPLGRHVFET